MKLISGTLCRGIIYFKHLCPVKEDIIFIWLREKLTTVTGLMFLCLLAMIQNWELKVGLGKQMKCLEKVKKTIRPEMVLMLETSKQFVLLQLIMSLEREKS